MSQFKAKIQQIRFQLVDPAGVLTALLQSP